MRDDLSYLREDGAIGDTTTPQLLPIEPGYPKDIEWPDGTKDRCYTVNMENYAVHTCSLLKTCEELGGVFQRLT